MSRYTIQTDDEEDLMLEYLGDKTQKSEEQVLESVLAMMLEAWRRDA